MFLRDREHVKSKTTAKESILSEKLHAHKQLSRLNLCRSCKEDRLEKSAHCIVFFRVTTTQLHTYSFKVPLKNHFLLKKNKSIM